MRDPKRIKKVLDAFNDIWNMPEHIDLRFFQILALVTSHHNPNKDLFYLEDEKLLESLIKLKKYLNKEKESKKEDNT